MNEPTASDIAAVQATLPAAEPVAAPPTPAPVAPTPDPTPQPAPVATPAPAATEPVDPFASLFTAEPTTPTAQPTEPSQTPQPSQPVEPTPQPVVPSTAPLPKAEEFQSYDAYMGSILAGVPKAPDAPDPSKINADSPEEIKAFFDNMFSAAEQRIEAKIERKNAIQTAEKKVWEEAFVTYPTLRTNQGVRDMVHNIRMGFFQRGVAITPSQAAKKLVDSLSDSYKKGIADNSVISTIESVQPQGGTSTPVATSLDKEQVMTSVQTGGEGALAQILDAEIKAGRM